MPQEKKRREKKTVWKHYKKTGKEDDAHPSVECNYCSKEYHRANPKRMQKHLDENCQKAPNNAKSQFRQQMDEKNDEEQKLLVSLLARALCTAIMPQEKKRREKKTVWKHYKKTGKEDDAHPSVECNYCSKEYHQANPKRMQKHLDENCQKAPNNAKSQFRQQMDEKNDEEQKLLVSLLAWALCTAKVPPSFIDNESVILFFQFLKPSFKLPNSEELGAQMNEVVDQLNYSLRI